VSQSYRIEDRKIKGKREYDRLQIERTERSCLCGRPYRYPWAWAIVLPARTLIDLCSHCSRALRYGDEDEQREIADRIARVGEWRLAA
jgi:hypothetical protein